MKKILTTITVATLTLSISNVFAAPQKLITHNKTNVNSNAFVAGIIPSRHATKAHSTGKVIWTEVKIACLSHTIAEKCAALVKMAVNTPQEVDLGWVTLDIKTGDLQPKTLANNGYCLTVNGPGETTLTECNTDK